MICPSGVDCEIKMTLPATAEAIEDLFIEFRRQVRTVLARRHCFAVELMAREALNNAVVHGCQGDPMRRVRCRMRLKGGKWTIAVDDDGEGFDWRGCWGRGSKTSVCSGRGMEILLKYATRVRYNDKGNAVTIVKRCD
jgi:serine/threonine-protein kinase RsbW